MGRVRMTMDALLHQIVAYGGGFLALAQMRFDAGSLVLAVALAVIGAAGMLSLIHI